MLRYLTLLLTCIIAIGLDSCQLQTVPARLILKRDSVTSLYGYYDDDGHQVLGDYYAAYTDTITEYGIVADPDFVLIDKTGKHIYKILPFDNGPDYCSEGTYRIVADGKIGYVDSLTSKVIIEPKFDCAFPFENGKAKVSVNCKKVKAFPEDEHWSWESENWFYVDKTGKIVK
mgnify:CR=1 FL=1